MRNVQHTLHLYYKNDTDYPSQSESNPKTHFLLIMQCTASPHLALSYPGLLRHTHAQNLRCTNICVLLVTKDQTDFKMGALGLV